MCNETQHYLSVQQPWAWMIDKGGKTLECRTYRSYHRGPLVILASKLPRNPWPHWIPQDREYVYGVSVCLVNMVDCRPMQRDDWKAAGGEGPGDTEGRFVWQLEHLGSLPPVPIRGRVFLFQARNQEINRHVSIIRGAAQPST